MNYYVFTSPSVWFLETICIFLSTRLSHSPVSLQLSCFSNHVTWLQLFHPNSQDIEFSSLVCANQCYFLLFCMILLQVMIIFIQNVILPSAMPAGTQFSIVIYNQLKFQVIFSQFLHFWASLYYSDVFVHSSMFLHVAVLFILHGLRYIHQNTKWQSATSI